MKEQLYLLTMILIITGIILWQSYSINDFNIEGIIFGIRVPEKYRNNKKVLGIIKDYRKGITIVTFISALIFLVFYYAIQKAYIVIFYVYILIVINMYGFYLANRKLKIIKKDIGWSTQSENKVYVQIGKSKVHEKVNLGLFYIAGVISVLGLIITIFRLPSLPKMVPIHFGVNGPDNWTDSTTLNGKLQVLGLPIVSIVCVLSMFFSVKFQGKKDNSTFNGGKISTLILKKSYSIKSMTKMLGLISIGVSLMIFYGVLLVVGVIQFSNISNYIFLIMTICAILFPLLYWIYNIKKAKVLKSENDNNEKEIYRDDDDNYIYGMFYYNVNDPSNIVRSRISYKLDFNYAQPLGKIMFLLGMIILIGIAIRMISLGI